MRLASGLVGLSHQGEYHRTGALWMEHLRQFLAFDGIEERLRTEATAPTKQQGNQPRV